MQENEDFPVSLFENIEFQAVVIVLFVAIVVPLLPEDKER